jgi:hypothetical protein
MPAQRIMDLLIGFSVGALLLMAWAWSCIRSWRGLVADWRETSDDWKRLYYSASGRADDLLKRLMERDRQRDRDRGEADPSGSADWWKGE